MTRTLSTPAGVLTVGLVAGLVAGLALGCKKSDGSRTTATAPLAADTAETLGCNHDTKSDAVVKHSWPYPADSRDLRWGSRYRKMQLRLRPSSAAFVTATLTWKQGELIEVEDSQVHVNKARRLIAKRDLYATRKVWDQGIEIERTDRVVAAGEAGNFLFYNSRGMCMLDTEQGPAWTPCTLSDAFVGLSAEHPFACEQTWWVKVRKSRTAQGWMPVALELMERVPRPGEAK